MKITKKKRKHWIPNQVGDDNCMVFGDDYVMFFGDDSYYGFLLRSRITATMDSPWIPAKAGITVSLNSGKTNTEIS